jgi:hypothetical protein
LKAGVFNERGTEYLRTAKSGHLDLLDAIKYMNLNVRWGELPTGESNDGLLPGQMRLGPFRNSTTFKGGVTNRPI